MNKTKKDALCALCGVEMDKRICRTASGTGPGFCPTLNYRDRMPEFLRGYEPEAVRKFAVNASIQEAECYANRHEKPYVSFPVKPRIQETWEFARKMGYKKLGLAFCAGLAKEAALIQKLFQDQGFEVVSVVCKVGGVPKEFLGIREEDKIKIGEEETLCNPLSQAEVLNDAGVEFALVLGLCVGHDSLFIKQCKSPVTVLAVKDRVMGHNPLAALYTMDSYYVRIKQKPGK
jgi:uncharacterized metal-binding protein